MEYEGLYSVFGFTISPYGLNGNFGKSTTDANARSDP